jgi:AraC-like DNA-binding protein
MHAYHAPSAAKVLVLDCEPAPGLHRLRRFALPPGWLLGKGASRSMLLGLLGAAPVLQIRRRLDLDALTALVDADLAQPWSLQRLAAACHLSPQRLRARFAQALGLSPMAFVRQRRLARAAQLLRQGWSLEAAALHVGYARPSALSHALRRDQGTGARALRSMQHLAHQPGRH